MFQNAVLRLVTYVPPLLVVDPKESTTLLCVVAVADVMATVGAATVIVEVSTSVDVTVPNWSEVVMVKVAEPPVVRL